MPAEQGQKTFPAWDGAASTSLYQGTLLGPYHLDHRIAMAPLTRLRADGVTRIPGEQSAEYYAQRASKGGLIISEATIVSDQGGGYKGAPGIYTPEHIKAWKEINDAVHAKGGIIFCQFIFLGRVADPGNVKQVMAVSDIPADKDSKGELHVVDEKDLEAILKEFKVAAECAKEAGFDGVELHGANGYFIDQFLQSVSNQRTDQYGGSVENRMRFPFEVMQVLASVFPSNKLAIRLSPFSTFQGMRESDPYETFVPWTEKLTTTWPDLAYVHVIESRIAGNTESEPVDDQDSVQPFREIVEKRSGGRTKFMTAGGWDPKAAAEHSKQFPEDLIAFGRYFIANPDLPERIKNGHPCRHWDRDTFYSPGPEGYTDQPTYQQEIKAQA